jgi:hypothetical protein
MTRSQVSNECQVVFIHRSRYNRGRPSELALMSSIRAEVNSFGCKWGRPLRTGVRLPSTGSKSHLVSVYHSLFTQPRKAKTTSTRSLLPAGASHSAYSSPPARASTSPVVPKSFRKMRSSSSEADRKYSCGFGSKSGPVR